MKFNIRLLYLYLFSFVGLLITVIGSIQLVDLGMKVYVFNDADKYEYMGTPISEYDKQIQERENTRNRQRQASTALAMIFVGTPLYLYHWREIKKAGKN